MCCRPDCVSPILNEWVWRKLLLLVLSGGGELLVGLDEMLCLLVPCSVSASALRVALRVVVCSGLMEGAKRGEGSWTTSQLALLLLLILVLGLEFAVQPPTFGHVVPR